MAENLAPPASPRARHVRRWVTAGATAAGLTALATAGLAGTAGTALAEGEGHAGLVADTYGTRTVADGPADAATPAPNGAAPEAAPGTAPQMRLQLAYKRTGPNLALTINLNGFVYRPLDAAGKPMPYPDPASVAIGLGQDLAWGDGTGSSSKTEKATCGKPAVLHAVEDSFTLNHTYPAPGTYLVTYTFKACGLTDGKITASIPIKVNGPSPGPAA